jgi:hypothetical protein
MKAAFDGAAARVVERRARRGRAQIERDHHRGAIVRCPAWPKGGNCWRCAASRPPMSARRHESIGRLLARSTGFKKT